MLLSTDTEIRQTEVTQLRLHLHRGIGYLAGDPHLKPIQDLNRLALVLLPRRLLILSSLTKF